MEQCEQTITSSQLRRIDLAIRPESRFSLPKSDGYSVYGALLSVLDEIDPDVSTRIHDSTLGSLHNSGLQGVFGGSDRHHHKSVRPDERYQLTLGIVDPADIDIFQALISALVLEGETIELTNGSLSVERFESVNTTHEALLDQASKADDPRIEMCFETATCIEEVGNVTTMFPHRGAVFRSLLGKWNQSCPDDFGLDLSREAICQHVIEKPDPRAYETHSVLVNRVENENGESRAIFSQGFTGTCGYAFKDESESLQNAITALALFAEYSGVGSSVARGCGNVTVEVNG